MPDVYDANVSSLASNEQTRFDVLVREWYSASPGAAWEDEFSRLIEEWREVEWRSGGTTLMAALGLQFQEVSLCRGLAWLLDPEGGHGLGRQVLLAFLRSLDVVVGEDAPVQIRVEEARAGTRADIVVRVGGRTVIIEAKVFAGEQPHQADRLYEHWAHEDPLLVFLTRTGQAPFTARASADRWVSRTWRQIAQLARVATVDARPPAAPSAGAHEFIETIGAL